MASPVAHSVVCREDKGSFVVIVEIVDQLRDLSHSLIHDLDVVQVLARVWSVSVAICVQSKQMQEKDKLILSQARIQFGIRFGILEQLLHAIEDPVVQLQCILAEIFKFMPVRRILNTSRYSTRAEHGQDIWATPTPCMPAPVENAVEVDRVQFPAGGNGRHILVQACNQGNMARSGFGGDAGVRDTESAMFENSRSEEGCQWLGLQGDGVV